MATRDQQDAQEAQKPEQVENNQDNYVWCNQLTDRPNMPLSLSYDLEDIGDVAEHVLKSTVYSALGAVLHLGSAMTVWIDWDHRAMSEISMLTSNSTPRTYYSGVIKKRDYHFKEYGTHKFGLNDAMQRFRIRSDKDLQAFGLELHESRFHFIEGGERTVRYLILHPEKVKQGPYRCNLIKWLEIQPKDLSQAERDKFPKIMARPYPLAFMN